MNRRQFLTTAGMSSGLAGVSGCLNLFKASGLDLGGILLANQRDEQVEGRLRVTQNGTTVLDERYSLQASQIGDGSGVFRNDAWEDKVAIYEVTVEVETEMSESFEYTDEQSDGECTIAYIEIREGTIAFSSHRSTESAPCQPN